MPLSHLLDTSVYCQPLKPKPVAGVEKRWRRLGDDALGISVICEAELLFGVQLRQSRQLEAAYQQFLKDRLQVLAVDTPVARLFASLKADSKKKGHSCTDFDFLIAATAKAHGLVLATLNYRHFAAIEGLAVEDWSQV